MTRRAIALAALATSLVAVPAVLHAQDAAAAPRAIRFGLAAGATFPTGDAGDLYDWGFHLAGSGTYKAPLVPVGFRGEVMWHRLTGAEFESGFGTVDVPDANVIAGIVNAELGLGGTGAKPYLIGGLGVYRISAEDVDSSTDFGFNIGAGVGLMLAGFDAFAELRYHSIQSEGDAVTIIPISFGVRF